MPELKLNGKTYSGSTNYASSISYTEDDGSKTTVQDKISELNSNKVDKTNPTLTWNINTESDNKALIDLRMSGTDGTRDLSLVRTDKNGNTTFNTLIDENGVFLPVMDSGWVEVTPSAANTPTKKAVTFNRAFDKKPYVVVSPMTSEIGTKVKGVAAQNFTTTGFDVWLNRTDTTATGISWIAIGI